MASFQFSNIRVGGIACAVPVNEIDTESYKPLFGDEEVEKFMAMTGVRRVRRTLEHQTTSDLGYRAAKELLAKLLVSQPGLPSSVNGVCASASSRHSKGVCMLRYQPWMFFACCRHANRRIFDGFQRYQKCSGNRW